VIAATREKHVNLTISFDYDSPAGYRESFTLRDIAADSDYAGASALLNVLARHAARATFGVVGNAALEGAPPEHCADQIRALHAAGHEIASHSMLHRYIPSMTAAAFLDDARQSRLTLERCIGAPVCGFIPPFNRPMHFPGRGAFSVSETLGLHGRGRGRQSVSSILRLLSEAGYGWSRVSYQNKFAQAFRWLNPSREGKLQQPFLHHKMLAIPLHCTGFGDAALALVRRWMRSNLTLAIYAHPNQAFADNEQSAAALDSFLKEITADRAAGRIHLETMAEVELRHRRAFACQPGHERTLHVRHIQD
jgi:peptidoglycan/xylan/chitin deacetylase (PgdA/CDA1 family)